MKLYQKLLLGFALVALLVGCVGYVAQTMNARVEYGVLQLSESAVPEVDHASAMALALRESQEAAGDVAARGRQSSVEALREALAAFETHLAAGRAAALRGRARAEREGRVADVAGVEERLGWLADLGTGFERYQAVTDRLVELAPSASARIFLADSVERVARDVVSPSLATYRSGASRVVTAEAEAVRTQLAQADQMLFVAVLLAIGMTLVLGILIAHTIARPIQSLTEATRFVGGGRLDFRLKVKSNDEVGELADAFNTMTEELSRTTVSKQYLDTIIHSMADPLFVTNVDGVIELVNGAAVAVAGGAAEDFVGQPLGRVLAGGADEAAALIAEALHLNYSGNREAALCQHDGGTLPVVLSAAVMRGGEGEALGIVCVATDLTQQKRVEAELIRAKEQAEEASRLKSNFLANMSHEIRTPLNGIIGSAQVLSGEIESEEREVVEIIHRSGLRLLGTINSVLDMARIEAGELHPHAEPVLLREEAADALGVLRSLADEKGLALTLTERTPDVWAAADPSCIHRILYNLVGNAIKFTREGEVNVELGAEGGEAVVRVRDTGIGIDPRFLPHLFDDFKQESTGVGRSHEGTGLGLAITKRLVELMGGSVRAESAKGVGTTFTVRLPRYEASSPESPAASPVAPSRARAEV
jgi:PAS domain S-box-containing protein